MDASGREGLDGSNWGRFETDLENRFSYIRLTPCSFDDSTSV